MGQSLVEWGDFLSVHSTEGSVGLPGTIEGLAKGGWGLFKISCLVDLMV